MKDEINRLFFIFIFLNGVLYFILYDKYKVMVENNCFYFFKKK